MEREPSLTARLKRADPLWWWLRENFRLPSIVVILACAGSSWAWLYSQHSDLVALKRRDPTRQLEAIAGQLSTVLQKQSAMNQRLEDFSQRIEAQERRWEHVEVVAESPHRRRH